MTEAKPDDVKILCPKCFEICDYAYADPLSSVCLCVKCDKRFDLGDSYKAQLTAANKRIAQLENPGQTNFCELCESAGIEIERLKAEIFGWEQRIIFADTAYGNRLDQLLVEIATLKADRLKPIDEAIKVFDSLSGLIGAGQVMGVLHSIRAKYSGE